MCTKLTRSRLGVFARRCLGTCFFTSVSDFSTLETTVSVGQDSVLRIASSVPRAISGSE